MTVIREDAIQRRNGYEYETKWLLGPWNGTKALEFGTIVFQPGEASLLHFHREVEEIFYVISGRLTLQLGSALEHLDSGCAAHIPPGTVHQGKNESSTPVKFVVVKCPPSASDKHVVEK